MNQKMGKQPVELGEWPGLPWEDFRKHGFLWLVNAAVFHPRGYALAMVFNDDRECTGWTIMGDGTEPWMFDSSTEERAEDIDRLFRATLEFLNGLKPRAEGS